jgi:beta-lactamase regulating signal transducer with metallopeptidase domain
MSHYFLQAALRSSLLLGFGALLWPLLPKQRPEWRRRMLLVFFGLLLVAPSLPTAFAATSQTVTLPLQDSTFSFPWSLFWIAGSVVGLTRLSLQMIGLRRVLRKARDLGKLELADCQLRIKETASVTTPCMAGWHQATLLVPPGSSDWHAPHWQCILWHERQHAVQHDVAALWFIRLTSALYWWNPLVHLAARQFHIESEATCDAAVLRHGTSPRDYVAALLSFSAADLHLAPSFGGRSALRKRVARFLQMPSSGPGNRWRLAAGMTTALLVAAFSAFCGFKSSPISKDALQEEAEIRFSADPFPSTEPAPSAEAVRPSS